MAVRKGLWLPSTSYLPEDDRLGVNSTWYPSGSTTNFLSLRSGVIPRVLQSGKGPLQVYNSSGLISNVAAGQLVYQGSNNATQGAYIVTNDATVALTHNTRDATFSRIDSVYIQVTDTSEGDGTNNTVVAIAAGTPSGSPVAATIPTGAYKLSEVTVPPGASALTYNDKRTFTVPLGGALPCTSTTHPANPYDGQMIYETDTNKLLVWMNALGVWRMPFASPLQGTSSSRPTGVVTGQRFYETDTTYEYIWNGSKWIRDEAIIVTTADDSWTSNTTNRDVTSGSTTPNGGLTFSVETNSRYDFELAAHHTATSGVGLNCQYVMPANCSLDLAIIGLNLTAAYYNTIVQGATATTGGAGQFAGGGVTRVRGTLQTGATSGTFKFQFSQAVSNAATSFLLKGTSFKMRQVA